MRSLALLACSLLRASAADVAIVKSSVTTVVEGRVAESTLEVRVINNDACPSSKYLSFSLPARARVTGLTMVSDSCTVEGSVKELQAAQDVYSQAAESGEAAALLESYNTTAFGLSVALPASGAASVTLSFMELLQRRNGVLELKLPLLTNMPANDISTTVSISDPASGGLSSFTVPSSLRGVSVAQQWLGDGSAATATFSVVQPTAVDAQEVPQVVELFFDSGPLPEEGAVVIDSAGYFMHLFNPPSLQQSGMARDVVFVVDVSGSMSGTKLSAAKAAFQKLIDLMTASDLVAVQTFSNLGLESSFGPVAGTASSRAGARAFVAGLETIGGTNLNDAYLEGLSTLKGAVREEGAPLMGDAQRAAVPLLVLLTDGLGGRSPAEVLSNVNAANANLRAKIYNLAFGQDADFGTLQAISLYNGGRAARIHDAYGEEESVWQIEREVSGEVGTVVCSDIEVSASRPDYLLSGGLSVLALGAELVHFGRPTLGWPLRRSGDSTLQVTTRGRSHAGAFENVASVDLSTAPALQQPQSAAKGFVYERLSHLSAWEETYKHLSKQADASSTRAEALALALEFAVVWPGLTAMVAHSEACRSPAVDASCSSVEDELDLASTGDDHSDAQTAQYSTGAGGLARVSSSGAGSRRRASLVILALLPLGVFTRSAH